MPQACVRTLAQPAVPARFPDHPLVVVNIGHTAHRGHTCVQHLGYREELQASLGMRGHVLSQSGQGHHVFSTCICLLEGSCTMAVPFTFLSSTPQVPAADKGRVSSCSKQQDKVSHPVMSTAPCRELPKAPTIALHAALLAEDKTPRQPQEATGQRCHPLCGGLFNTFMWGDERTATPCH